MFHFWEKEGFVEQFLRSLPILTEYFCKVEQRKSSPGISTDGMRLSAPEAGEKAPDQPEGPGSESLDLYWEH